MDHPGQPGVPRAQVTASDSRCPSSPQGVPSGVHAPLLPSQGNRGRAPTRLPGLGQHLPFPGRTLERGHVELHLTGAWARGEKRKPRHGSVAEALVPSGAGAVLRQNSPENSTLSPAILRLSQLVLAVIQCGPSVPIRRYHDGGLALQVDDQILRVPQGVRANPDPTIGWPGQVDR